MKAKILTTESGEKFYPITHISTVLVNEEVNLEQYLNNIIKSAPHEHSNKDILDLITKEYTIEKDTLLNQVANKVTVKKSKIDISSSNWYGEGVPYTYLVSIPGISIESDIRITVPDDITIEEFTAFKNADIIVTSSGIGEGVVTLSAFGTKPTIDIPIVIISRGIK